MSELDRIAKQLADLQAQVKRVEATANAGAFAASRAIRRGRIETLAAEREETWKRLSPNVALVRWNPRQGREDSQPDLSGSLIARLRQGDPVADSLGNVDPGGFANLIKNPLLERDNAGDITLPEAPSTIEFAPWHYGYKVTDQGTGDAHVNIGYSRTDFSATNNPFNSTSLYVDVTGDAGASGFAGQVYLWPYQWIPVGVDYLDPFLVASLRVTGWGGLLGSMTKLDVSLQLLDDIAGTPVLVSESPSIDMLQFAGVFEDITLSVAQPKPAAGWSDKSHAMRLKIDVAFPAAGDTFRLYFGEPLMALQPAPAPPAFAPALGTWMPSELRAYNLGHDYPLVRVYSDGIEWGDGVSTWSMKMNGDPGQLNIFGRSGQDGIVNISGWHNAGNEVGVAFVNAIGGGSYERVFIGKYSDGTWGLFFGPQTSQADIWLTRLAVEQLGLEGNSPNFVLKTTNSDLYESIRFMRSDGALRGLVDIGTGSTEDMRFGLFTGSAGSETFDERIRFPSTGGVQLEVPDGDYTNIAGMVAIPFSWSGTLSASGMLDLPFIDAGIARAQFRPPFAMEVVGISIGLSFGPHRWHPDGAGVQRQHGTAQGAARPPSTAPRPTMAYASEALTGSADFAVSQLVRPAGYHLVVHTDGARHQGVPVGRHSGDRMSVCWKPGKGVGR